MQTVTEAIVLHLAKYSDRASILHAYTKENGRTQYMVYGLNGRKKNSCAAIFEPMSLIEIEAGTRNTSGSLQQLRNAHLVYVPQQTRTDMRRRSISIFMAEILYRTLHHPLADKNMFDFLRTYVHILDTDNHPENIHLQFLLQLTEYLGIQPDLDDENRILDLQSGTMTSIRPTHTDYLTETETTCLKNMATQPYTRIERSVRQRLIEKLCRYYELHITDFQSPKSLDILSEIFND